MKKIVAVAVISLFLIANSAESQNSNLYPFKTPGFDKYGYIDDSGNTIIYPEFDQVTTFKKGISIYRKGNFYGFVNENGKIISPVFTEIRGINENVVCAKTLNRWSYYDTEGKQLFNKFFEDAYLFNNGLARVFINNRYGYIDKNGNLLIKATFDYAENFSDNYAYASYANKDTTIINKQGKAVIKTTKDYIYNFSEGIAVFAGENNRYGYINKSMKQINKAVFQYADTFYDGLGRVKINNKWGFVNKSGNYVINPNFDEIKNFSENLAAFRTGSKWGFLDKSGKIVIRPEFNLVRDFSESLAAVNIDGLWGYINSKNEFVIRPRFENAESFNNNLAKVNNNAYIDKTGNYIWSESQYADKSEYKVNIDSTKYNLGTGQNVCVNYWGENLGFCGVIQAEVENKYRIKVSSINCGSTNCSGGCSDNLIDVTTNTQKIQKFVEKGLFIVEVYKDCITDIR